MQVKNNSTTDTQAVEAAKEAQKASQTKNDSSKQLNASQSLDPAKESERLSQSAKDFSKGITPQAQATQSAQAVQDANKVEDVKNTVKADAFRRDMEKMVRA